MEPVSSPLSVESAPRPRGLWRHGDFLRLWAGQTVSQLGSTVTREALPLTAILALGATPLQMGLLGAAGSAPLLLFGLFAGVWVDRLRRRPLMIAVDLGRALVLLSVPLAWFAGWLSIDHLYIVAALVGLLSVCFSAAYGAYLPTLVSREQVMDGNSKLGMSDSVAEMAGPPLGGALVQAIGGPIAMLLDAVSFVVSALSLAAIRTEEPAPAAPAEHTHVFSDIAVGLRAIAADPWLRPMALSTAIRSFFGWFFGAIYGLYVLQVVGASPTGLGIAVAAGGAGALFGALVVRPVTRRIGVGPAILGALALSTVMSWLIIVAGEAPWIGLPLLIASQLIGDMGQTVAMINETSLRQTVTPDRLLGRVNASMDVCGQGIGTLGLLVGGALGELIGLQATVLVALAGGILGLLVLLLSPVRRLREMPPQAE